MKSSTQTIFAIIACVCLAIPSFAGASGVRKEESITPGQSAIHMPQNKPKTPTTKRKPLYRPPLRGAPGRRIGGGTRGAKDSLPELVVLAPDHTGLTIKKQPTLYWYLSKPVTTKIEITLNDETGFKPVLEINLNAPDSSGIQRVRLSDHGINLKRDEEYEWFVAVVFDSGNRSQDVISGGVIKRAEPSKALLDKLEKADKHERLYIYAEEGLWYDAMESISELIAANPEDRALLAQRASLLEQVGLPRIPAQ